MVDAAPPGYRPVAVVHGVAVYAQARRRRRCPAGVALPHPDLVEARLAVLRALPRLRVGYVGMPSSALRAARARAVAAPRSVYSAAAGGCGRALWRRSVVVFAVLPHLTASLSQVTVALARFRAGWLIWARIH
jgi:hypothetical protein